MTIQVSLAAAFAAGLLSFLSPCVLPLVPAYLSFVSGAAVEDLAAGRARARALAQAGWFVLGFSVVFVLLGASASAAGRFLLAHLGFFAKLAGAVIVLFGLHFMGLLRFGWLARDVRFDAARLGLQGPAGAFVVGAAFAFGWSPCVGPILGAILALASVQEQMARGMLLLAAYSAGLAIPFLLAALATQPFLAWSARFKARMRAIEVAAGVLLVATGVLIMAGSFSELSAWLLRVAPWLGRIENLAA